MIERLPQYGHYKSAVWDDDDVAETLAKLPRAKTFGLNGWTPERAQLSQMIEYLSAIHSRLVAQSTKTGRGPKIRQQPRPETAVDRLETTQLLRQHDRLTAAMVPHLHAAKDD